MLRLVDRVVRATWKLIAEALTGPRTLAIKAIRSIISAFPGRLKSVVADALDGLHVFAHTATVRDVVKTLLPVSVETLAARAAAVRPGVPQLSTPGTAGRTSVKDAIGVVFPPPPKEAVQRIVRSTGWEQRIERVTKLARPEQIADRVVRSFTDGTTGQELVRELTPVLQGVQASARRVVRTEAARVAHEGRMAAYQGLADLVVGYQIHAVKDSRTRPEHLARDGEVYYANPQPGQKGYGEMPKPPLEADGSVAHNCRCWLTPVLRDDVGDEVPADSPIPSRLPSMMATVGV